MDIKNYVIRLKRGAEHRKRVLEKKKELEVRKVQVKMDEIAADRSPGKVTSHNRHLYRIHRYLWRSSVCETLQKGRSY